MSFLYPRIIAVHRPATQAGEGAIGYGGQTEGGETVVATGIRCNIQLRREGQRDTTGLPADANRPTYDVRVPKRLLPLGTVKDRDIVIDDLGVRYIVQSAYWDSLGYALRVETLEA